MNNLFENNLMYTWKEKIFQETLTKLEETTNTQHGNIILFVSPTALNKGFILDNSLNLNIQENILDIAKLKSFVIDTKFIIHKVKEKTGISINTLINTSNKTEINKLIYEAGLEKLWEDNKFKFIFLSESQFKPNLVFDIALQSPDKLELLAEQLQYLGYDKKHIHIVWLMYDLQIAMTLNTHFLISDKILHGMNLGIVSTMKTLLHPQTKLREIIDGKIIVVFNEDAESFTKKLNYHIIKDVNKDSLNFDVINSILQNKLEI